MHETTSAPPSLSERKRLVVQQRIVDAAHDLFSAQGFDNVSVTEIAARADVGRTTFFRYFGDKPEVVFTREQEILDAVASFEVAGPAVTLAAAIEQLLPLVIDLFERVTADADAYFRHTALLEQHLELRSREALKMQQIAERLSAVLERQGTPASIAALAGQVALACYLAARRRAEHPGALVGETRAAFDEVLRLGVTG